MSAFIASKVSWIWKKVGSRADVPPNPVAELMYYLHCVGAVINLEEIDNIDRLEDYKHYYDLTLEEIDDVVRHCDEFRPEYLEGRCFFLNPDLCVDSLNEFYELTVETTFVGSATVQLPAAAANVTIAGHLIKVNKRMFYREKWANESYYIPVRKLRPWLDALQSRTERPIFQCRVKVRPKSPFPESEDPFSKNIGANVLLSYFFPLWTFVWFFMTIFQS